MEHTRAELSALRTAAMPRTIFFFFFSFTFHSASDFVACKQYEDNADWNCMRRTAITFQLSTGIWFVSRMSEPFLTGRFLAPIPYPTECIPVSSLFASAKRFGCETCENKLWECKRKETIDEEEVDACVCLLKVSLLVSVSTHIRTRLSYDCNVVLSVCVNRSNF